MTRLLPLFVPCVLVACGGAVAGDPVDPREVWSADRAQAQAPDAGVRWAWEELSCEESWGWQSLDKLDADGLAAGVWTAFPPRDLAVQVVGPEALERCLEAFERGATYCAVETGAMTFTLGPGGELSMQLLPEVQRAAHSARVTTGAVSTEGLPVWIEDAEGARTEFPADIRWAE